MGFGLREAVYPRVGGGNAAALERAEEPEGLSPRGRGKLSGYPSLTSFLGSIPAWAGETRRDFAANFADEVYPRVGGGNPA